MAERIKLGDRLPEAEFLVKGPEGPGRMVLSELTAGRKVVLFALPGAFTPTCDSAHLPSFVRTAPEFAGTGVDEILCVSVNDVHVMTLWGEQSGATAAGIRMLADADGTFSKAMGLTFSNPAVGFFDRSQRYALVAEDGVVTRLHIEQPGVCAVSTGEAMLAELG